MIMQEKILILSFNSSRIEKKKKKKKFTFFSVYLAIKPASLLNTPVRNFQRVEKLLESDIAHE